MWKDSDNYEWRNTQEQKKQENSPSIPDMMMNLVTGGEIDGSLLFAYSNGTDCSFYGVVIVLPVCGTLSMPDLSWTIHCSNYLCGYKGPVPKTINIRGKEVDLSIALVSEVRGNICAARGCHTEIHSSQARCALHDTSGLFGGFGIGYGKRS